MGIQPPFNLKAWIEDHRDRLKPPVGNQVVYKGNDNFIVMCVGGPNTRTDFHVNRSEELFYQLEGDVAVVIMENGRRRRIEIGEGEMFLLPPGVPHSPRRPAGTVGLVVEIYRDAAVMDGFQWFCEGCDHKLYEEFLHVSDIVKQLPPVFERFWGSPGHTTCSACGRRHLPPK